MAKRQYRIRWRFDDGDMLQDPAELELHAILHHCKLLNSDNPRFRRTAMAYFGEIAELVAAGRIAKRVLTKAGGKRGGEARRSKNADRDSRIHDLNDEGMARKRIISTIAKEFPDKPISESIVSRVLAKPRP